MNKKNLSHKKPYVLLSLFYLLFLTTISANEAEDKVEKQENWRLPNLEEGDDASRSKCFLLSPKITINDGQGKTRIWLEITDKSLILKTKSDIDTGFNDIGIKIDDKDFIIILNVLLHFLVVKPIIKMADVADRMSKGEEDLPEFNDKGKNEIAILGASFNRMKRSLEKAMSMLGA